MKMLSRKSTNGLEPERRGWIFGGEIGVWSR